MSSPIMNVKKGMLLISLLYKKTKVLKSLNSLILGLDVLKFYKRIPEPEKMPEMDQPLTL